MAILESFIVRYPFLVPWLMGEHADVIFFGGYYWFYSLRRFSIQQTYPFYWAWFFFASSALIFNVFVCPLINPLRRVIKSIYNIRDKESNISPSLSASCWLDSVRERCGWTVQKTHFHPCSLGRCWSDHPESTILISISS